MTATREVSQRSEVTVPHTGCNINMWIAAVPSAEFRLVLFARDILRKSQDVGKTRSELDGTMTDVSNCRQTKTNKWESGGLQGARGHCAPGGFHHSNFSKPVRLDGIVLWASRDLSGRGESLGVSHHLSCGTATETRARLGTKESNGGANSSWYIVSTSMK